MKDVHEIDLAQGRIWNQDYINYVESQNEINRKKKMKVVIE